jgi:hypothetical protein
MLQGSYGDGASNAEGYFQIDAAVGDRIILSSATGQTCGLDLDSVMPADGYLAAGKVICQ